MIQSTDIEIIRGNDLRARFDLKIVYDDRFLNVFIIQHHFLFFRAVRWVDLDGKF